MKPLLFVTGRVPAYRVGGLARLHEREHIEVALFGGPLRHGGAGAGELPFPHRHVRPRELFAIASAGGHRAVVCPTAGRLAPVASWAGARRAGLPVIVWASLWAHPRTPAHALTYLPLRHLYRTADAVVTYGPHVSAYVAARGARNVHVAPQAVDNDFWRAGELATPPTPGWPSQAAVKVLFVGRRAREKGIGTLLEAWRASGLRPPQAALVLVGVGSSAHLPRDGRPAELEAEGVVRLDPVAPAELRAMYAAGDALVLPSIATRTFREPWGLVVNEAMNRALPVLASDAVGAAAGGLVRDGTNGLVVPAGDAPALAAALRRLAGDEGLRVRLGRAGAEDVLAYTHDAWARGFSTALASLGLSRERW